MKRTEGETRVVKGYYWVVCCFLRLKQKGLVITEVLVGRNPDNRVLR